MTFTKIALVALTFAVSTSGAFAGQTNRTVERDAMLTSMERTTGARTTIFGLPPSKPTIWGHAAPEHATTNDVGRVVTGG
jgi:hypothetical protein